MRAAASRIGRQQAPSRLDVGTRIFNDAQAYKGSAEERERVRAAQKVFRPADATPRDEDLGTISVGLRTLKRACPSSVEREAPHTQTLPQSYIAPNLIC